MVNSWALFWALSIAIWPVCTYHQFHLTLWPIFGPKLEQKSLLNCHPERGESVCKKGRLSCEIALHATSKVAVGGRRWKDESSPSWSDDDDDSVYQTFSQIGELKARLWCSRAEDSRFYLRKYDSSSLTRARTCSAQVGAKDWDQARSELKKLIAIWQRRPMMYHFPPSRSHAFNWCETATEGRSLVQTGGMLTRPKVKKIHFIIYTNAITYVSRNKSGRSARACLRQSLSFDTARWRSRCDRRERDREREREREMPCS